MLYPLETSITKDLKKKSTDRKTWKNVLDFFFTVDAFKVEIGIYNII